MRTIVLIAAMICGTAVSTAALAEVAGPKMGMIEAVVNGRKIEGMPLAWASNVVHLLGRDGRLWSFAPDEATNVRQTSSQFRPYSVSEIRANLLRELGSDYEVSGTSHYMVAHPRGQRDQWAERFEDLYRSFVRYFSVRGFHLTQPQFPLIGIVCRDRADFQRYAAKQGVAASGNVLGFYDLNSNRIIVYDVDKPGSDKSDWQRNASTIIHEATHQLAFNTGIHNRFCPPPLWVIEGLATLFEAPGVHDSRSTSRPGDRVNRERLSDYKAMLSDKHNGRLPGELTASDRLFRSSPMAAYAEAWALAYYLVETHPRQFARYLALTASHPPFMPYSAKERLDDFTSVFGSNWRQFDAQFGRFMEKVK